MAKAKQKTQKEVSTFQTVPLSDVFGGVFAEIFSKPGTHKTEQHKCHTCDGTDCDTCDAPGGDYLNTVIDLKPVLVRISVMAAHCHDLIQAHTPGATRALTMLAEIDLLTKDGMKRIEQTGLEL